MTLKEISGDIFVTGGIFKTIYDLEYFDFLTENLARDLDYELIFNKCGDREISSLLLNIYNAWIDDKIDDWLEVMASIIYNKFKNKWDKLYTLIYQSQYNPIHNYDMEEIETPDITKTETPNIQKNSITKQNIDTTSTNNTDNTDNIYGFNSSTSVPLNESNNTNSQNVTANADNNFTDTTENETGTRTHTETGNRTLTRSGNIGVTTTQKMMKEEIDLRQYNLFNEILNDVCQLMTRKIYVF